MKCLLHEIKINYKYTSLTFGFSLLLVTVIRRILCFVCTIQCKHNNNYNYKTVH